MKFGDIVEQFNEHLKVEKEEELGKGCQLINFSFYKDINDEGFYSGDIQTGFMVTKKARFKVVAEISKSQLICYEISQMISTENVVKLIGFGANLVGVGENHVVVAYDMFDTTYKSWAKRNGAIMDGAWWVVQIPKVLDALDVMRNNKIYHGDLDNLDSYVGFGGDLCIINFSIKLDIGNTSEVEAHEKRDRMSLLKFLTSEVKDFPDDSLWTHFLSCFKDFTVNELRKHPILLQGIERYNLLRELTDVVRNHMLPEDKKIFEDKFSADYDRFYLNWGNNFAVNDIFYTTLNYGGKAVSVSIRNSVTLIEFIEKLLDHFQRNAQSINLNVTNQEMLESKISNHFPLFLSRLHFAVVTHATHFEVTSYHPSRIFDGTSTSSVTRPFKKQKTRH